jgi:hypothetical protein
MNQFTENCTSYGKEMKSERMRGLTACKLEIRNSDKTVVILVKIVSYGKSERHYFGS